MLIRCSVFTLSMAGSLLAQHGGGHGGGFSGGGHSGGGVSHSSSSFIGSGMHSGGVAVAPSHSRDEGAFHPAPSFSGGVGIHYSTFANTTPFSSNYSVNNSYRNGGEGRPSWGRPPIHGPIRYGYYGFYPILPLGFWGNDFYTPSYDSGASEPYYSYPDGQQQMEQQYEPYGDMPPDARAEPDRGGYPPVPYRLGPEEESSVPEPPSTPITLVLKNGQKMEIQNYAVTNGAFWDFSKAAGKRILLSEIDVPASVKATDEAGGVFPAESFGANPK